MVEHVDLSALTALRLPRIYQLGLVVHSIDRALQFYGRFLSIRTWYRGEVGEQETAFHGAPIEMEADMVFGYSGKLMIELIEVKGGAENIYTEHLERFGEGLHHLGVEVSDFDRRMQMVEDMGISVLQSGTVVSKGGAISRMAYLDTAPLCGYPIELMETRLFGVPCGKSRFMMRVGCLLGDATKIQVA